jgi:hypothetical protein
MGHAGKLQSGAHCALSASASLRRQMPPNRLRNTASAFCLGRRGLRSAAKMKSVATALSFVTFQPFANVAMAAGRS